MKSTTLTYLTTSILMSSFSTLKANETVPPYLGTIKQNEAHLLFRPAAQELKLRLNVFDSSGKQVSTSESLSSQDNDFVAKFHIKQLSPDTRYTYTITDLESKKALIQGKEFTFKTLSASRKGTFTAAFIACVNKDTKPVWQEIDKLPVDALVLAGDTPYIDVSELNVIRSKHRAFLQTPELAQIGKDTSVLGNWDDHDFGVNNGNGKSFEEHKAKTRKGFLEYRAHDQQGDGKGGGIYHKTDHGPIEIFHLDPRWYSMTAPSTVDPTQPTCFGKDQWQWIKDSLKASKAPFKVLSMGAIWQDKRSWETDDMFTYWYERDDLLDFIKKEKITGVVLHGGDIHCSRYLMHPQRIGYDLHDFIMSPGHNKVIPSLNVFHPSLEWSLVKGNQFLLMRADTTKADPILKVEYRRPNGEVAHAVNVKLSQLQPKENSDLRAHWSFDGDLKNKSVLGDRLNGSSANNPTFVPGKAGKAIQLDRAKSQYVNIPRSMLDDNSDAHTISMWIKPKSLSAHGSSDRHFLFESTAQGKPSDKSAFHWSLGFRPSLSKENINLQLHTKTIRSATKALAAPTEVTHKNYDLHLKRDLFTNKWTHLTLTFNSSDFKLYLDGKLTHTFELDTKGPATEFGGLIIGGHRAGKGRNFDGLIDEVKIWNGERTAKEIEAQAR